MQEDADTDGWTDGEFSIESSGRDRASLSRIRFESIPYTIVYSLKCIPVLTISYEAAVTLCCFVPVR